MENYERWKHTHTCMPSFPCRRRNDILSGLPLLVGGVVQSSVSAQETYSISWTQMKFVSISMKTSIVRLRTTHNKNKIKKLRLMTRGIWFVEDVAGCVDGSNKSPVGSAAPSGNPTA